MSLLDAIKAAIALIFGHKTAVKALQNENTALRATVESQAATIADLKSKLELDEADDADLIARATAAETAAAEAEARAAALTAQYAEVEAQGKELAAALTASDGTPSVDDDFNVVEEVAPAVPVEEAPPAEEAAAEESSTAVSEDKADA